MPVRIWTAAKEMRISAKTGFVCLVQMLYFDPVADPAAGKDGPLAALRRQISVKTILGCIRPSRNSLKVEARYIQYTKGMLRLDSRAPSMTPNHPPNSSP